jgi:hypothetical protein
MNDAAAPETHPRWLPALGGILMNLALGTFYGIPALYLLREQVIPFYILLCAVYYCYGTQLSVYASTSDDFYGTKSIGLNYGLLFAVWGVTSRKFSGCFSADACTSRPVSRRSSSRRESNWLRSVQAIHI